MILADTPSKHWKTAAKQAHSDLVPGEFCSAPSRRLGVLNGELKRQRFQSMEKGNV